MFEIRFQDKNNSKLHEHALIYTSTLFKIETIVSNELAVLEVLYEKMKNRNSKQNIEIN